MVKVPILFLLDGNKKKKKTLIKHMNSKNVNRIEIILVSNSNFYIILNKPSFFIRKKFRMRVYLDIALMNLN